MDWIHDYQLFLFDFDGLLVNTEEIHFRAYREMCARYGYSLNWTFAQYCQMAYFRAEGLKEAILQDIPELFLKEPDWNKLYSYKKQRVIELLSQGEIELMPGVFEILIYLQKHNIKHGVVTHSSLELVSAILKKHPILRSISCWITREDYSQPKPNPEGYLKAIQKWAKDDEKIIGFEDTPRGIQALLQTRSKPVLISSLHYPELPFHVQKFSSFTELFQVGL